MGGAETLAASIAGAPEAARLRLEVCCLKSIGGNPLEREVRAAGIPCVNLGARNLRDAAGFGRLVRLIGERRIELIHAHLTYASIWGAVASRLTGVPLVSTLHVAPAPAPPGSREAVREALRCSLLDRWAGLVIAVSRWVREAYHEAGMLDRSRMRVVHNGIRTESHAGPSEAAREAVRREFGFPPDSTVLTSVAVLRGGKGVEVLLEAAPAILERAPHARFLVVGDGPLRRELEERSVSSGLGEAVRWAGWRRDVPRLLAGSEIFLHPTLEDALPTVLLEAAAASLPAVATRTGGVPEIVDEGATGLLVPPRDAAALAGAVASLLGDGERRRAMGEAGREKAAREFSTAAWIARLEAVYTEVLSRGEAP